MYLGSLCSCTDATTIMETAATAEQNFLLPITLKKIGSENGCKRVVNVWKWNGICQHSNDVATVQNTHTKPLTPSPPHTHTKLTIIYLKLARIIERFNRLNAHASYIL